MVSEAALDAGGYVHGIIPNAMLASSAGIYESGSQSPSGEEQKEKGMRGAGTLVVHDDVRERLTMEIVGTMHEVCHAKCRTTTFGGNEVGLINASEEAQNGGAGHGWIYCASRRVRDF